MLLRTRKVEFLLLTVFCLFLGNNAYAGFKEHIRSQQFTYTVGKNSVCEYQLTPNAKNTVTGNCKIIAASRALQRSGKTIGDSGGSISINTDDGTIIIRSRAVTPYCDKPITIYSRIKDLSTNNVWNVADNGSGCKVPVLARDNCSIMRCGISYDTSGAVQSQIFASQDDALAAFEGGWTPPAINAASLPNLPHEASANGKYNGLIATLPCPKDRSTWGAYNDYGHWGGGPWCGQSGPAGFWVYVAPNWYVWKDLSQ